VKWKFLAQKLLYSIVLASDDIEKLRSFRNVAVKVLPPVESVTPALAISTDHQESMLQHQNAISQLAVKMSVARPFLKMRDNS
jgi:hypothetical protein